MHNNEWWQMKQLRFMLRILWTYVNYIYVCTMYNVHIFWGQRWILLTYRNTCGQDIRFIHNQQKSTQKKQTPLNRENCRFNLDWAHIHVVNSVRCTVYGILNVENRKRLMNMNCTIHKWKRGKSRCLKLYFSVSAQSKIKLYNIHVLWSGIAKSNALYHIWTKWYNNKMHRISDVNMN